MALSQREKAIALVANGIAVYSLYQRDGSLPENTSLIDFVTKAVPDSMRSEITIEIIDEVFNYVSGAHNS